jgi:predicted RecB family endonuclease
VGLAVGVGLLLGESVVSGVGETEGAGDADEVTSLVEVLESVEEEIIPKITNTVTMATFCQGFKDKNLPHTFFNTLASSDLYKISDQETRY